MAKTAPGLGIDGVLLVTGGGSGIGREIALSFAAEGARGVHICDINKEALDETAKDLQACATSDNFEVIYSVMNVMKPEDCDRTVADTIAKWGRLDVCDGVGVLNKMTLAVCRALIMLFAPVPTTVRCELRRYHKTSYFDRGLCITRLSGVYYSTSESDVAANILPMSYPGDTRCQPFRSFLLHAGGAETAIEASA